MYGFGGFGKISNFYRPELHVISGVSSYLYDGHLAKGNFRCPKAVNFITKLHL